MMDNIEQFIKRVSGFEKLPSSTQIIFFMYYLSNENSDKYISSGDIRACFEKLHLKQYSNISYFLNSNSKGKKPKFLKYSQGYRLTRESRQEIEEKVNDNPEITVTSDLISLELLIDTQYYMISNAKQMCVCYDLALYDACLVMMRKLIETLIIECFERYGQEKLIKDDNGYFQYLSDLIPKFSNCDKWNVSRNLEASLKKIKKYGDLSAHNRRFVAKKNDVNELKFDLRQAIQEIVLIIDYPNWKKGMK